MTRSQTYSDQSDCLGWFGNIILIKDKMATIRVEDDNSCSACALKGACSGTPRSGRLVEIRTDLTLELGEAVYVTPAKGSEISAAILLLLVPSILITGTVLLGQGIGTVNSALLGLGIAGLYFIALRIFEPILQKKLTYSVKKLNTLQEEE